MNAQAAPVLQELAPTGVIRAAINFGNPVLAQRDSSTGEAKGVSVDLANELGRRLGVAVELVTFEAAGKVVEALKTSSWDVAFLAIDPVRAAEIAYTAPYVIIEGTYLVRDESPLTAIEEFDRPGIRIAVGKGAAYDLFLTRALKHAELVRAETSAGAINLFVEQRLDAAAGVRQPLLAYAAGHDRFRVIPGRFTAIEQAMGTPRGREVAVRYLRAFVEEAKVSGFVARGLERSGQRDASVAPSMGTNTRTV
jgi:polar amino acid transport system substrate-binding protein